MTKKSPVSQELHDQIYGTKSNDAGPRTKPSGGRIFVRFSIFGVVLATLVASVIFFVSRLEVEPSYKGGKVVGKLVPDVTVTTLGGEEIALRSLTGKKVVINFFNSWCVPCQEEEPALRAFRDLHKDDPNFVFIGIARDDTDENIRVWADGRDVPFTVTLDTDDKAAIAFGTVGQPETYAIGPNGKVIARLLARADADTLDEIWTELNE